MLDRGRIVELEEKANKLQDIINVLLTASPKSPEHWALCEEQAAFLAQERDKVIAQMIDNQKK